MHLLKVHKSTLPTQLYELYKPYKFYKPLYKFGITTFTKFFKQTFNMVFLTCPLHTLSNQ